MQTKPFTLKVLSPLHIGRAESEILPMMFFVNQGKIHVISEEKLGVFLLKKNMLDPFVQEVNQLGENFQLNRFLKKHNLFQPSHLSQITLYQCKYQGGALRSFRPFIRNAFAQPYIPGSSVKGAWRTAIVYCLLKQLPEEKRKKILDEPILKRLQEVGKNPKAKRRIKQNLFQHQEEKLLRVFQLKNKQEDIHTDIFRVLKVHDSPPLGRDSLVIREVRIYSARSSERVKKYPLYVETIEPGVEIPMAYSIDEQLLEDFQRENQNKPIVTESISFETLQQLICDPIGCANEMAMDVLAYEKAFFQEVFYNELDFQEEPNFHLGWGGSLIAESISLLLPEDLRQRMRNVLFTDRGNAPAPKSRKVIASERPLLLGWCQLIET